MLSFVVVFVVFTWTLCHICQYLACFHFANLFSVLVCVKLQIHSAPCLLWSGGFLYINKDVNCINPSLNTCCVVISRGADILFVIAGMKLGVYCSFSTIHTWQFTVFFSLPFLLAIVLFSHFCYHAQAYCRSTIWTVSDLWIMGEVVLSHCLYMVWLWLDVASFSEGNCDSLTEFYRLLSNCQYHVHESTLRL